MAWRNCSCPNSSPWEIKHLFCGSAREHSINPSPNPWPPPREMSRGNRFLSYGQCTENHKIINEKYPFKIKWHGLMNDAVTGKQFGLRSLCAERFAFRLTGWGRRCVSQRSRHTLCSQTPKQHFCYACERLIQFQRCLKSIYGQEKCKLSTARVHVPYF